MRGPERKLSTSQRTRLVLRIVVALVLIGIIAAVNDDHLTGGRLPWLDRPLKDGLIVVAGAIAFYAVRLLISGVSGWMDAYLGVARSRSVGTVASVVIDGMVVLVAVNAAGLNLSGILVGGALTGVVIGIAGQAALSNVIAGLVILFARPFAAGMYVTVRAGAFGGVEYSGQVWDISLFYTTLRGIEREVRVPNGMMISAVTVVRPERLEIDIPIVVPKENDITDTLARLRSEIEHEVRAHGVPQAWLEAVTDVGYTVRVRLSVATESERRTLERIVGGLTRTSTDTDKEA